uniref:Major facilitator superfamily (MFS) profile domain-containing protein n=1 Tax=Ciona savignyi TaxID=51511 RepID=H2Z2P5_CIOSA
MFVWMVTSMVYYGLMLNAGSLPGSVYFNNMMGGLVEFLACTSAIFIVTKVGFTKTTSCSLYVASLACLSSTLCIQFGNGNSVFDTIGAVFAMIGRFGASMAFGVIFTHTVEMFPTVGRATALGLSSMAARFGSTFSPFTVQIQLTIPWLTPTIFGILAFLAASLALNFPETKGKKLLMSFDDAENSFAKHFCRKFITKLVCLSPNTDSETEDSPKEEYLLREIDA